MRLALLAVASLLVSTAAWIAPVPPAAAQDGDPIAERQQLMKNNGRAAKSAGQMLKGEIPFDAATAAEIFRTMNGTATRFGELFPDGTQTGHDTEASPAIWERPADFQAAVAKFEADTAAALEANPQTLEAFQASFKEVGGNCRSCHEDFRVDN